MLGKSEKNTRTFRQHENDAQKENYKGGEKR